MKKTISAFVFSTLSFVLLLGMCPNNLQAQGRHYVNAAASGANNGSSWTDAFTTLYAALNAAADGDSIFVADGVYTPDPALRSNSLEMKEGLLIYGGFAGTEDEQPNVPTPNLRTLAPGGTILSGAIGGSGNSYHVVRAIGVRNVLLNRFTIQEGEADNGTTDEVDENKGGALFLRNAAVILEECTVQNSRARLDGGAAYSDNSRLSLYECFGMTANTAGRDGGAIYYTGASVMDIPRGCVFTENVAGERGGAIFIGSGALANDPDDGNRLIFLDSFYDKNRARNGGAIFIASRNQPLRLNIAAQGFRENEATELGGGIAAENPDVDVYNCVFFRRHQADYGAAFAAFVNPSAPEQPSTMALRFFHVTFTNNESLVDGGSLWVDVPNLNVRMMNVLFWDNRNAGGTKLSYKMEGTAQAQLEYCLLEETSCLPNSTCDAYCIYNRDPQLYKEIIPVPQSVVADAGLNLQGIPDVPNVGVDYGGLLRTCVVDIGGVEVRRLFEANNSLDWMDPENWSPEQLLSNDVPPVTPSVTYSLPDGQHNVLIDQGFSFITPLQVNIPSGQTVEAYNLYLISQALVMENNSQLIIRRRLSKEIAPFGAFMAGNAAGGGTVIFENDCGNYTIRGNAAPQPRIPTEIFHIGGIRFNNVIVRNPAQHLRSLTNRPIQMMRKLDLEQGNFITQNNLTLLSNPDYTAMVVNQGSNVVEGLVNVQRHVTQIAPRPATLGYNHFSSPVDRPSIDQFSSVMNIVLSNPSNPYYWANPFYTLANFPNFFKYIEGNNVIFEGGTGTQRGWRTVDPGEQMQNGRGYTVNLNANVTVQLRGTLNNGNINIPVTRGTAARSGWNLLGNPYPAPIDWDLVQPANAGVMSNATIVRRVANSRFLENFAFYVAGTPSKTGTNGATNLVQSMQGFFILASGNGTFSFNNAMRATSYSNPRFFRNEQEEAEQLTSGLLRLELGRKDNAPGTADETIVYFRDNAADRIDRYDGIKEFFNFAPAPNIFTMAENRPLAINALPAFRNDAVVPLAYQTAENGNFQISINAQEFFKEDVNVLLHDTETNKLHYLSKSPYEFTTRSGRYENRFLLRFSPASSGDESALSAPSLLLFPNPASQTLNLRYVAAPNLPLTTGEVSVMVSDLLGRPLYESSIEQTHAGFQISIPTDGFPKGTYLLSTLDKNSGQRQVSRFVKE